MVNSKLAYNVFLVVVVLLIIFPCTFAYETKYEENFKEGEELSTGLDELDILEFSYYNKTYSLRVLGIYSNSAAIRVEHRAFDINVGETKSVNLDKFADYDLDITLLSAGSDTALLKLKLDEKPWYNEINQDDQDQADSTNSANTTDVTNNSTTSTSTNSSGYIRRRNTTKTSTTSSSQENSPSTNSVETDNGESQKTAIIGDAPINITINITLTPKSAIGLLLIVIIVLVGMFAYKGPGRKRRRGKKGYDTVLDKLIRKLERKVKEIWKIIRVRLGELIAGKKFDRKNKGSNKKLKTR